MLAAIRSLGLGIMVAVGCHQDGSDMARKLMAYRPAPIVLQYLSHAGQAGLKAVDGAIIDRTIRA